MSAQDAGRGRVFERQDDVDRDRRCRWRWGWRGRDGGALQRDIGRDTCQDRGGGVLDGEIWVALLALPQPSVAVQVRVEGVVAGAGPGGRTSVKVRRTARIAVVGGGGVGGAGVTGQSLDGDIGRDAARTGAVVSWTVRIWVAVLALPQPSVAVQVRVRV